MLEIFELFENWRKNIKAFILKSGLNYVEIKAGKLITRVIKDHFEVMKVFINKIVKVDFLFGFFLFIAFFLHL